MPSRKRNKGKDRKAKKAEMEARKIHNETLEVYKLWRGAALGEDIELDNKKVILCNHGIALTIPEVKHPVCSFMDTFHLNLLINRKHILENLGDTYIEHSQVWHNESYRTMARDILLEIGTNLLLGTKDIILEILPMQSYVLNISMGVDSGT